MIIVFPILVSRAVSENSIPGIAKTLENYLIVNKQDLIINSMNDSPQSRSIGRMFRSKKGFAIKEDVDLISEAIPDDAEKTDHKKDPHGPADAEWERLDKERAALAKQYEELNSKIADIEAREAKVKSGEAKATLDREKFLYQQKRDAIKDKMEQIKDLEQKIKDQKENEKAEKEKAARKASAKVQVSDMKSVSLEPTYMTIEKTDKDGNRSTEFLGIKVIPMRVKSDAKLSHLILQDTKLNTLSAGLVAVGRSIMRWFYRLFDKWTYRLRILGGLTASGDPRRDIIMGRTGMGKGSETFLVISKQEDVDDYFLDNVNKINRLYKMGWGNFVVADDIGRVAYFCMQSFRGLCNAVPYAMMYQYLGQSKAYESMEDAKKANSSIFKIGPRFTKLIGEWKVERKLNKFSQLNEGFTDE